MFRSGSPLRCGAGYRLGRGRAGGGRGFPGLVGALVVTSATATITYMPVAGSTAGWHSIRFIGGASLAVILMVAFVTWELRHGDPLMRLGIFRLPAPGPANVITFLFGAWNAGEVL